MGVHRTCGEPRRVTKSRRNTHPNHITALFGGQVPHTEEELAHYGEKADAPNPARDLLDDVRKRKVSQVVH